VRWKKRDWTFPNLGWRHTRKTRWFRLDTKDF
jgi:hypothetical protein